MFSKAFWKDAAERAIRTAAQTLIAVWPVSAAVINETDWSLIVWTVVGATVLSLLTSLVGSQVGNRDSAALVAAAPEPPQ